MDESALRILLSNLDASRSSLHGLLHIFNWFVIFGLGFDLFVILKEFRDDWKDFRYGQVHPYEIHLPKRPSVVLLILGLIGTALIVIGVAGEWNVDVQAGKIETQIREANDALLGLVIQEAGTAKSSAELAAVAASRAKTEADQAAGIAKAAKAGALDAERQVASVRSEAASLKAELDAEKEDLRRIRAARYIPDTANFISELRPFKDTKYLFWTVSQDADSLRIAILLNELLKYAGWIKVPRPDEKQYDPLAMNIFRVSNPAEYIPPERFTEGIRIFINSPLIGEGDERSVAFLRKISGDNLPSSLAPAEALASDLNERMFPPEHTMWGGMSDEEKSLGYRPIQVLVIRGGGTDAVIISVGPKPP